MGIRAAGIRVAREPAPGPRRWTAAAVAALLGAGSGWLLTGLAQTGAVAPGLTAQAVRTSPDLASARPLTGVVRVSVTNAGRDPARLDGHAGTAGAASITGRDPADPTWPGGFTRQIDLRVSVRCDSTAPLTLPPLGFRVGGGRLTVPVTGGGTAVADLCDSLGSTRLLVPDGAARRNGRRLGVPVRSRSGRELQVTAARAGGVRLPVTDPVPVGTGLLWLEPAAGCPAAWRTGGFPAELDVEVTLPAAERADVPLPLGAALTGWLLAETCGRPR